MGLRYAVVTSVNRDDQPDGGAQIFARTIAEIRRRVPGCRVEVLIPDFRGDWNALGNGDGGAAQRAEPQYGNGAALTAASARARSTSGRSNCSAARARWRRNRRRKPG